MADPYVYPGTDVLRNRLGLRDAAGLERSERLLSLQRLREGLPLFRPTPAGYRAIHRHLFQDLYPWAGQLRSVNLARGNHMFCLVPHLVTQLAQRLGALRAEGGLRGLARPGFADRAATHAAELNAIHPFRDGNGRTLRGFLQGLARQAGHRLDLARIAPEPWNRASRESFATGEAGLLRDVIGGALAG